MTTQLSLYNGALRLCKERKLASLSENREPRRLLDDAWGAGATGGAVKACLQAGQWTFATRTSQADATPSVEPSFGYRYAFNQPEDMVRVTGVAMDQYFTEPLLQYTDERGYWYCDLPTIYVRYVSNDTSYGGDMSLWPESFVKVVEAYLAREVGPNLMQGSRVFEELNAVYEKFLKEAKSVDAMNSPTKFAPAGSWVRARSGNPNRSRWNGQFN